MRRLLLGRGEGGRPSVPGPKAIVFAMEGVGGGGGRGEGRTPEGERKSGW